MRVPLTNDLLTPIELCLYGHVLGVCLVLDFLLIFLLCRLVLLHSNDKFDLLSNINVFSDLWVQPDNIL